MDSAALFGAMSGGDGATGLGLAHDYPSSPYSPGDDCSEDDTVFSSSENPAFATASTLATCAQYLEPVLRDLGLKQWQLLDGDAVAALNRLYELVQLHHKLEASKAAAQEELHKAKMDVKTADKNIQRLQSYCETKEQEVGGLNIKLRQLEAWYREEAERWANEREEFCRKCSQLEQRHVQFQHELRRRDTEHERLQKHLSGQLTAAERRRAASSSTVGAAGAGRTAVSRTNSASGRLFTTGSSSSQIDTKRMSKAEVEEMHKRSVEAFEAEKQGLQCENAALRKALNSLEREHKELLNRTHATSRSGGGSNGSSSVAAESIPPAAASADPAAALHRMQTDLQALKVRKQRITGGMPLSQLQQEAESASERLLLAKLQEAGRIMEEQESALVLAVKAISATG